MTLLTLLGVEEKRGETMMVRGLAATQAREEISRDIALKHLENE